MSNITVAQDYLDNTFGQNKFIVYTSIGSDGIEVHDAQGDYVEWFDNQAELEGGMK